MASASSAPKTAEPATNMSAPASAQRSMVSSETPPSTWSQMSPPVRSISSRACRIFGQADVEELLSAEPGLDGHHQHHVDLAEQVGVRLDRGGRLERHPGPGAVAAQLAGQPHRRPAGLDVERDAARRRPRRTRPPSGPGPRSSGGSRGAATTTWRAPRRPAAPRVRFGTKWLSITSTCSQSALPTRGRLRLQVGEVGGQDARRDLDSPWQRSLAGPVRQPAKQGHEHRVRAVQVRPQLDVRARVRGRRRSGRRRRASSSRTSERAARRPSDDVAGLAAGAASTST